mmetsp:Transcript_21854/g.76699  ORF Transcript_21854/g.76699 Transcript_21854/m.76699 type:complete len:283 (-) Transcript_21854:447-1295(-)
MLSCTTTCFEPSSCFSVSVPDEAVQLKDRPSPIGLTVQYMKLKLEPPLMMNAPCIAFMSIKLPWNDPSRPWTVVRRWSGLPTIMTTLSADGCVATYTDGTSPPAMGVLTTTDFASASALTIWSGEMLIVTPGLVTPRRRALPTMLSGVPSNPAGGPVTLTVMDLMPSRLVGPGRATASTCAPSVMLYTVTLPQGRSACVRPTFRAIVVDGMIDVGVISSTGGASSSSNEWWSMRIAVPLPPGRSVGSLVPCTSTMRGSLGLRFTYDVRAGGCGSATGEFWCE